MYKSYPCVWYVVQRQLIIQVAIRYLQYVEKYLGKKNIYYVFLRFRVIGSVGRKILYFVRNHNIVDLISLWGPFGLELCSHWSNSLDMTFASRVFLADSDAIKSLRGWGFKLSSIGKLLTDKHEIYMYIFCFGLTSKGIALSLCMYIYIEC